MPDKRKPSTSVSGMSPYAKRSRVSYAEDDEGDEAASPSVAPNERPRNDPLYGQKSAFPGLDDSATDELFYGPAEDGLEYLRMVRSEANSLPSLFVAVKASSAPTAKPAGPPEETEIPEEDLQPTQPVRKGVYADGVYFVSKDAEGHSIARAGQVQEEQFPDAQAAYYNLLRHRFLLLRTTLRCTPPPAAIAALDDSHPISLPANSKLAHKEWRRLLLAVDPQMVQLACMDIDSVLGVLGIMARLISENIRSGDEARIRRMGAWAWGLLGKCREVGEMATEEVGEIRGLGKRAVTIVKKMREENKKRPESDDGRDEGEVEPGDTGDKASGSAEPDVENDNHSEPLDSSDEPTVQPDTGSEELEAAKLELQRRLQSTEEHIRSTEENTEEDDSVRKQIGALLDMILTVVGEYYGQLDLLEARGQWEK
ncbi:hypothetical protein ASPZODRAFT_87604 [Penicilliopsis zonata CBS 506.65]|uniref:Uncharacterized protein n=1 Tax=Penicilliopsis zonata CBS 506.65 TaxID=1073090 RepID=A0A1L9SVY4_9EURO|nr:hypothetical protein ASPZODRAFT_87604 [Penicilliopsis zonata CBS 506.65]OJJ51348.1 hypothetical protein ASPZODRAFT_87604 [Penicilliopsis zonata CBS 506.65]